jgi:hypothetical protein
MLHGYRLRAEYEGLDPDTTISLPTGEDYVVGQAFADANDGLVVLDDEQPDQLAQIHTLDAYFAVKPASVPDEIREAHESSAAETQREARVAELDQLTRAQLDEQAAAAGIEDPAKLPNKPAVIDALIAAQAPQEA